MYFSTSPLNFFLKLAIWCLKHSLCSAAAPKTLYTP
uniref:Uncharacterized protein n=1 Tax=Arundo donax TaxID=35708 RepID=A0A0A9GR27_ARUDO